MTEEDYMDMKKSTDTDDQISAERYEQNLLFNKNAKAVMQAINEQNTKLAEYQQKLVALTAQVSMMNAELARLKQDQMEQLIAKMGTGSTVHFEDE